MQTEQEIIEKLEKAPLYKVLLHNDDKNSTVEVVINLRTIFGFTLEKATKHMQEAHETGVSIVMVTNFERAELYRDKMRAYNLTSSIEKE
jgi:ATP-dependent Clp protease adapter protein ClpS